MTWRVPSLYFVTEYEYYGKVKQYDLIPNGSCVPVTSGEQEQYVELYTNFLLEESIASQFNAFSAGFHQVCGGPALALFRPEELGALVRPALFRFRRPGTSARITMRPHLRDSDCEGLLGGHPLHDVRTEVPLLSSRGATGLPLGDLGASASPIQRSGADTEYLPTSHTCFNILLLPDYSSKEKLETKLAIAIATGEGFGSNERREIE